MKHRIEMLWPDGLNKALTFSYDDGVMQDMRLTSLMRLYGIKGTFNLNSGSFGNIDLLTQRGREVDHSHIEREDIANVYRGFETAVHSVSHPFLTQLTLPCITEELIGDRIAIEALTGRPVRGMAWPYGAVNADCRLAAQACGLIYARGVRTTGRFSLPEDPLDWSCSCHHSTLEDLIDPFLREEDRLELLSVWGHSYEFDLTDGWDTIERQLERLGGNDDTWYATNIEIFDYINAFRSLRWTAEGDAVENPFSQSIFLRCDGETVCIPGGSAANL